MNRADMAELGLAEHDKVDLVGDEGTNGDKRVDGLLVVPYDIPRGCLGGYYPECNILMPVTHKAEQSHVPAGKSVPVRVEKAA